MNTYTITYTVEHNGELEDHIETVRHPGDRKALYTVILKQIKDNEYHSFTTDIGEQVYRTNEILSFTIQEAPPSRTAFILY